MSKTSGGLWHNVLAVQVYGANTGVGKTVFSTLLGAHFSRRGAWDGRQYRLRYFKPVSTGPADEADELYVKRHTGASVATLFQYGDAVSPHVAARNERHVPTGWQVTQKLYGKLRGFSAHCSSKPDTTGLAIVETAGGVLSPGPSGTPQADIYRPMRLPTILVGDHRLGGIGSTISAAESLLMRGYDIDAIICFDDKSKYKNSEYLLEYFEKMNVSAFEVPWIPDLEGYEGEKELEKMSEYYTKESTSGVLKKIGGHLVDKHVSRLSSIASMSERTSKAIWHPFTQHKSIEKPDDILTFDSAYGDFFKVKQGSKAEGSSGVPVLYEAFDGSASWWTQGLGHGNPKLALAAAYAAGRYGHVMFAGATNEPAITLAETLLQGMENPRLKKCFYTDDGSTAAEVGIKMAVRAACSRYGWDGKADTIEILGLQGSYHGDTIGAMDASEPSVYNKKVDWHRPRGFWFNYPTVKMRKGKWIVEAPEELRDKFGPEMSFNHLDDVFDFDARGSSPQYEEFIKATLDKLTHEEKRKFGALVMEPIILGAGGMMIVDPLFQRALVEVVRSYDFSSKADEISTGPHDWTGVPVLFDEVFTGLYRLGHFTPSKLLRTHPDISIHAKLLTGGLLPLSVTLASQSIFNTFLGDGKADALLHGHSYTAHPIGCHVANTSLAEMKTLYESEQWRTFHSAWDRNRSGDAEEESASKAPTKTWSMWSQKLVTELSHHPNVDHVIALGSVLAVSLKDHSGSGYTSNAAIGLRDALLHDAGEHDTPVHSRVLGNVLYLMASMTSTLVDVQGVEAALQRQLDRVSGTAVEEKD